MRIRTDLKKSVGMLLLCLMACPLCFGTSKGTISTADTTNSTGTQAQQKGKEKEKDSQNMKDSAKKESPFFCDIGALNGEERKRIGVLINSLKAKRQEVKELSDGFAFRFVMESETLRDAAEFITYERLCCPFFDFELAVEREGGALWLRLRGREGVKEFIKIEFGL